MPEKLNQQLARQLMFRTMAKYVSTVADMNRSDAVEAAGLIERLKAEA